MASTTYDRLDCCITLHATQGARHAGVATIRPRGRGSDTASPTGPAPGVSRQGSLCASARAPRPNDRRVPPRRPLPSSSEPQTIVGRSPRALPPYTCDTRANPLASSNARSLTPPSTVPPTMPRVPPKHPALRASMRTSPSPSTRPTPTPLHHLTRRRSNAHQFPPWILSPRGVSGSILGGSWISRVARTHRRSATDGSTRLDDNALAPGSQTHRFEACRVAAWLLPVRQ